MLSWTSVLIGIACVPIGLALRARLLRVWSPPAAWQAPWVRRAALALVVGGVGVPAMTGVLWLAPMYGVLLGLIGGPRRRRCRLST